jgi:hypothetical protein
MANPKSALRRCAACTTVRHVKAFACLLAALLLPVAHPAAASETDQLTYRFLSLEDSAPKLNAVFDGFLARVTDEANVQLRSREGGARAADDLDAELAFLRTYRKLALARFGDRLLTTFEGCVERNDCDGWPRFERIALTRDESVYGEARYNRVAYTFIAPTLNLCGVRVGADKLTHLFSNGFLYYVASRREDSRLESEADVYETALREEHGLMGAKSTQVISPADAHATAAGWRLAHDLFLGADPILARDPSSGLLVKRRGVDLCAYVTSDLDEVLDPPAFTAGARKVKRLEAAIARRKTAAAAEESMSVEDEERVRRRVLSRALEKGHDHLPFFYKIAVAFRYAFAWLTLPKDVVGPTHWVVFPRLERKGRKPLRIAKAGILSAR